MVWWEQEIITSLIKCFHCMQKGKEKLIFRDIVAFGFTLLSSGKKLSQEYSQFLPYFQGSPSLAMTPKTHIQHIILRYVQLCVRVSIFTSPIKESINSNHIHRGNILERALGHLLKNDELNLMTMPSPGFYPYQYFASFITLLRL